MQIENELWLKAGTLTYFKNSSARFGDSQTYTQEVVPVLSHLPN